jgi:hypothetical protein
MINTIDSKFADIEKEFILRNCKLINFVSKSVKLEYICSCGENKQKLYKDFMKNKECRTCTSKKLKEKPDNEFISDDGQIWKPVVGGWISNTGKAKNSLGKDLVMTIENNERCRYTLAGKPQYVSRLLAEAFQLENYEKLKTEKYIVVHIDGNALNNSLTNLKVTTYSEINSINGKKSRQSETFKEKNLWTQKRFECIDNKVITELPKHIIYKNGEIWNGDRFLVFTEISGYLNICLKDSVIKVDRLICYAFNPIEGKKIFSDYNDLEPKHKDGNNLNNDSDNLEWIEKSDKKSYDSGSSKRVRNVLQYTKDGSKLIKEYVSIAEASRQTSETEQIIRSVSKGQINNNSKFLWKYKNEEESADFSKKYSKK